ncbi:MAG: glycosyl hydrolase family 2 [Prevotella sp.]|nr:glycosyl hydrolase family 2 [Prevotella sp.]
MKRHLLIFSMFAASLCATAQTISTAKPGTRWWWLGSAVDKQNLRWNMEQYASHGIGALEITPLYGVQGNQKNNIDFLSPKWMEMLTFVISEGKRLGIEIDMNNGTGWPFGGPTTPMSEAACKLVTAEITADAKQLKSGAMLNVPAKERETATFAFATAYPKEVNGYKGGPVDVTANVSNGKITWKAPKAGTWRIIAVYNGRTRQQVKRAAPGGAGLVIDHFDRNAVKHYLDKFDKAFAAAKAPWPQVSFNDSYEVYGADWTPTLPQEFETRRGYSLTQNIDKLIDRDPQVVHDYRETLSDMLRENFTNQWVDWAHSHGMQVKNQAHGSPANLLDLYAAVDIPEIEGFGLSELGIKGLRKDPGMTKVNDSDYSMFKYAPSAAHVTGKRLVSSETFTWLTEHFRTSLSQMKPDLDLMFCAGVNHIYHHGTCYSPKDDPWPGWKFYASIDMSPTNSIWRDAAYFNEYVERCQKLLQSGEPDNEILVYFPIHNLWMKNQKTLLMQLAIHNMGKLAPEFKRLILDLDRMGYDCDYISDRQLEGLRSTRTDKGTTEILTEAGIRYKAILIPNGTILTDNVKERIKTLKAQGVKFIQGNDANALAQVATAEPIKSQLSLNMVRRKMGSGYCYFIANLTSKDVDEYCTLGVNYKKARWYDPLTDKYYAVEDPDKQVRVTLRSGESMFLQLDCFGNSSDPLVMRPTNITPGTEIVLDKGWKLSFTEEAPKVGKSFNINKLQTWETLDDDSAKVTMGTGVYETTFNITPHAMGTYAIDLGDVRESARVYINNVYIGCAWSVPYILNFDTSVLKKGKNTVRIEVTNLPANRIADLDRRGVKWRKMEEINVVDIKYKETKYDNWAPMPSGLNSAVRIYKAKVSILDKQFK